LPAALDMARATTVIASSCRSCAAGGLGRWVTDLNEKLWKVMRAGRFVAATFLLVDQRERRVHACVAGLPAPKLLRESRWEDLDAPGNPPLGIGKIGDYRGHSVPLTRGTSWLLFSDGILELRDQAGAQFEDEAFNLSLDRISKGDPQKLLENLVQDWRSYTTRPSYRDDATIMVISDRLKPSSNVYEFTCKPDTMKQARRFVEEWADYLGFDGETTGLIVLGCDEIFTNICRHAYEAGCGPALCSINPLPDGLEILIRHEGAGIDDDEFRRLLERPRARRPGGLGAHVVDKVFDSATFERGNGTSSVRLFKEFNPNPA
jgi:anti-sigma regulatory factor (Ser/Thr protein kinase)